MYEDDWLWTSVDEINIIEKKLKIFGNLNLTILWKKEEKTWT